MRSITSFDLQYAHRFLNFQGEAQYLHGHTGVLTIEVEDTIEPGVNMVFPCNEIRKTAWEVLKNFDHALILREDDPLLPAILAVYDAQGIRNGAPSNRMKGAPHYLLSRLPSCRYKGNAHHGRNDQDRLRSAERQTQHCQNHFHERCKCSFSGI